MSKHSPALVFAIIIQFIAIVMAFSSFFLPIYTIKFTSNIDNDVGEFSVVKEVQFKYRSYICSFTNNKESSLDEQYKFSYGESPTASECSPFIGSGENEEVDALGFKMKVSLAVLALGFIGSVFTLLFTFIMSCHYSCRNIGMKIFAFLFSLVPFVFYLASPLVLLQFTNYFFTYGQSSTSSSGDCDSSFWCQSFVGSDSVTFNIPVFGSINGTLKWGPTYGWASGIVASILALVSAILTVCSARYRKDHHHHHHDSHSDIKYSKLINRE